jgi:hypothetical protein
MRSRASTRFAVAAIASALAGVSLDARADPAEDCASAAERAQALRARRQLREAHEQLLMCASSACPRLVRNDCEGWQREVDAELPSVVFRAVDSRARDVVGVEVTVDGRKVTSALDGAAMPMNPGPHRIRFEARSGAATEDEVLIVEAQKARIVTGRFLGPLRADGTRDDAPERPIPAPTWIALGAGAVALTVFTALEIVAQSELSKYHSGCGMTSTCDPDAVDATRTKFRVAGVALGVGVLALGLAAWTYFSRPESKAATSLHL